MEVEVDFVIVVAVLLVVLICVSCSLVVVVFVAAVWHSCSCSCSCLPVCLSIYLSICPYICLSIHPPVYASICLSAMVENEAILRDFHPVRNWQHQKTNQFCKTSSIFALDNAKKRSNFAKLPQFSKSTASKTKQFWETSFENGKLSAKLSASYQ